MQNNTIAFTILKFSVPVRVQRHFTTVYRFISFSTHFSNKDLIEFCILTFFPLAVQVSVHTSFKGHLCCFASVLLDTDIGFSLVQFHRPKEWSASHGKSLLVCRRVENRSPGATFAKTKWPGESITITLTEESMWGLRAATGMGGVGVGEAGWSPVPTREEAGICQEVGLVFSAPNFLRKLVSVTEGFHVSGISRRKSSGVLYQGLVGCRHQKVGASHSWAPRASVRHGSPAALWREESNWLKRRHKSFD